VRVTGIGDATAIAVSANRSCALRSTGAVSCWGDDLDAALGRADVAHCAGNVACSKTPVTVANLPAATSVAVGDGHVCALLASGTLECWGANGKGQLGTGSTAGPEICNINNGVAAGPSDCSTTPVTVVPGSAGATRCDSASSLQTCQAAAGCTSFVSTVCATGLVCESLAPAGCVDPSWAEWPMPNNDVDVAAGAPNAASYVDEGDTMIDAVTGLEWQKDGVPLGMLTLPQAVAACATLRLGGHDGWRLPSIIELVSTSDFSDRPSIDLNFFPAAPGVAFWSGTPVAGSSDHGWAVVYAGSPGIVRADEPHEVRCVR
jgi:hypothetical protein